MVAARHVVSIGSVKLIAVKAARMINRNVQQVGDPEAVEAEREI